MTTTYDPSWPEGSVLFTDMGGNKAAPVGKSNPLPVGPTQSTPAGPLVSQIVTGGVAVVVFAAGTIVNVADVVNPAGATELLYVDITTTAVAGSATSIPLAPGDAYRVSNPITTAVSVVAATAGHTFSAVRY